jgi:hypothetical protein
MSTGDRSGFDPSVDRAIYASGLDFHEALLRDLGATDRDVSLDERFAEQKERYPFVLFGELAMHVAGVTLPAEASTVDRARGITEALRIIHSNPTLFEKITGAPFTWNADSQQAVSGASSREVAVSEEAVAGFVGVQKKVAEKGFFTRGMLKEFKEMPTIQARYTIAPQFIKKGFRGKNSYTIPQSIINVKLAPTTVSWSIKRYEHWDSFDGYSGYKDTRELKYDAYELVAVTSVTGEVPSEFKYLLGETVDLGKVSSGGPLRILHHFMHPTKEVSGHEGRISKSTFVLPGTLDQLWIGSSKDHPLF